ncbi:hypothetical protein BDP27DRAFT_54744 [Rhodocollybia butyracea]|uniref:Uncharacterized protein n=1 Tax=Rhodocollybia butyracea TaxID=206335 RepID=A0A9P5U4C8_9AGAR|nr:hypothetical protein BDP27DRAFT_54744 [Rhodocollybia butyracea]
MLIAVLFYFIREGFALPIPAIDTNGFSQVAPNISSTRTVPGISLTTIFACTWVAAHPNIPSHDSDQEPLWRRTKILAVALTAPEYIILWAANQLWSTKRAVKQLHIYPGCSDWTLTHGMFLVMGGHQRLWRGHWGPTGIGTRHPSGEKICPFTFHHQFRDHGQK